ncbi:DUF2931 family protein [Flavobacterium branchiarum]|uniref:DUF2931 family protein n=1 Tax=Flavobacterium branchiarum TaxID=1114870 RepID=A0ABV5FIX3_9FLAO|nr:DUF2931 family protein [Flavobacterium branchiarum]MDN3675006.1 DUF2931 family protein [Flavobacterium branchiarum]
MKINILNKIYALICLLVLLKIGSDLWQKKEIPLAYYFLNKEKQKEMLVKIEKVEWMPETGGDKSCPVEVVDGSFVSSDNHSEWISRAYLNSTWGSSSGSVVVDDKRKKVPERMRLTWFSYAEDKFFTGDFELPQKKMYDIFKKDYGSTTGMDGKEYENKYNTLTLGFAPEGLVTLWIGGLGNQEIGTYQAHETTVEWSSFQKGEKSVLLNLRRKKMPAFVQEQMANNTISNAYFKDRLLRYQYKIGTNRADFEIYDYKIFFMNNEVISEENTGIEFITDTNNGKAVPIRMTILVKDQFSRGLKVRIWIDLLDGKTTYENDYIRDVLEQRTFNIQLMERFKAFFAQNENVELHIKFDKEIKKSNINKPLYSGKVYLKSPNAEVEIPNSKVEVYDVR